MMEKVYMRERKNKQIKEIGMRMLIPSYTMHYVIPMSVPNFKILDAGVHKKSLIQISLCITLE